MSRRALSPAAPTRTAIKVLRAGQSWHGGTHTWSLPTQREDGTWKPGAWTPRVTPRLCSTGYHLTRDPVEWWGRDGDVVAYLAEHDGAVDDQGGEKISVERCRLLRPLTTAELEAHGIYLTGEHGEITGARLIGGDARIDSLAGCKVREMWGSSQVREMRESSQVGVMWGSSQVGEMRDSATAHASGEAVVVVRRGYASCPTVTVRDRASVLDYRPSRPVHHVADEGQVLTLAPDGTTSQAPITEAS